MKKIYLLPFIALFLAAGTVNAHTDNISNPGILPGSPFYFLDVLSESIGTFFTFGDVNKAERYLELAGERLAEAEALAEKGRMSRAEKAAEKYQKRIDMALAKSEEAKIKGEDVDSVLEKIAEATVRHQAVLADVYEKVPEQAKETIKKVMEKSGKGHDTAINAISDEGRQEARSRVKKETKDAEDRLEELRAKGLPIPEINKGDDNSDDSNDVEENEGGNTDKDEKPEEAEGAENETGNDDGMDARKPNNIDMNKGLEIR